MPTPPTESEKWDFTVVQTPVPNPLDPSKPSGYFFNQRTDTNEVLGATSDRYGLMQNRELVEAALTALNARGMKDYEERILVAGGGQRLYAEFRFANRTIETQVGDVFGYTLTLKNSFDRSKRATFALGFLRLVCKNGMSVNEAEFGITQKHNTRISVGFIGKAIDNALTRAPEAIKVYDRLAQRAITDEEGFNALENLEARGTLSGVVREAIAVIWRKPSFRQDHPRNLYTLYNAVTQHLTHGVAATRFEYAMKTSNNVLVSLVAAVEDQSRFAKLILPAPKDAQTVMVAQGPIIDAEIVA